MVLVYPVDSKEGNKVRVVGPRFGITLHVKDTPILKSIQEYFKGVGNIIFDHKREVAHYSVAKLSDLMDIIIPQFKMYPLLTEKNIDFQLWEECIKLMEKKDHLTESGLNELLSIKSVLNKGLSDRLKVAFPNIIPKSRPVVQSTKIEVIALDYNWFAGFSSGESCFHVQIYKSKTKIGFAVRLRFTVVQHIRDIHLIERFKNFVGCGSILRKTAENKVEFTVTKLSDIVDIIIPLFSKYPVYGMKALDFADFCKVSEIVKNKEHLTVEGLEKIKILKIGMNRGRVS